MVVKTLKEKESQFPDMEDHKTRHRNNLDTEITKESMKNILTTLKKRKTHTDEEDAIGCVIQIISQPTVL